MKSRTFLLVLLIISLLPSCKKYPWDDCDIGEGDIFEKEIYFENFHTFVLDIPAEIIITPDTLLSSSKIVILGQQNVINEISVGIVNGVVKVGFNSCFKNHEDIKFHIYTPWLTKIVTNNAARVSSTSALYGEHFTMDLNSGSTVNLGFNIDSLTSNLNSSSTIELAGYASRHMIYNNSSSTYNSKEFISDSSIVEITGSGYVGVYVTGHLIANISGSGTLDFYGEDSLHIDSTITGSGKINDLR